MEMLIRIYQSVGLISEIFAFNILPASISREKTNDVPAFDFTSVLWIILKLFHRFSFALIVTQRHIVFL